MSISCKYFGKVKKTKKKQKKSLSFLVVFCIVLKSLETIEYDLKNIWYQINPAITIYYKGNIRF